MDITSLHLHGIENSIHNLHENTTFMPIGADIGLHHHIIHNHIIHDDSHINGYNATIYNNAIVSHDYIHSDIQHDLIDEESYKLNMIPNLPAECRDTIHLSDIWKFIRRPWSLLFRLNSAC